MSEDSYLFGGEGVIGRSCRGGKPMGLEKMVYAGEGNGFRKRPLSLSLTLRGMWGVVGRSNDYGLPETLNFGAENSTVVN